jgi:hypothetical protein
MSKRENRTVRLGSGRVGRVVVGVLAILGLGALHLDDASAHQDPPGCSSTGIDFAIEGFRADRTTPIGLTETVSPCETICVRASIAKPDSPSVCAFQGGTVTMTTPAGAEVVASPGDVPCLGGTEEPCDALTTEATTRFS